MEGYIYFCAMVFSQTTSADKITSAEIYTDGSCHTQFRVGAWVAILLIGPEKKLLTGLVLDTTHNRMELTAVIKAMEHVRTHYAAVTSLKICSDSQYVVNLPAREEKLTALGFTNKKGTELRNADLVKELLGYSRSFTIGFVKIKTHQKKNGITKRSSTDSAENQLFANTFVFSKVLMKASPLLSPVNLNIEADILSRKLVREAVSQGRERPPDVFE